MLLGNINAQLIFEKIKKQEIYKNDRFHVLLLSMKEGEFLKPHQSLTDAFLFMIDGEILFIINKDEFHLIKGDEFTFKANETHSVKAIKNAAFLLVK